MKKYTGTKTIKARKMTRGVYNHYRGWDIPEDENPADNGYLVGYSDVNGVFNGTLEAGCHYISWSPADVFEASYSQSSDLIKPTSTGEIITEIKKAQEGSTHIVGADDYIITEKHTICDMLRLLVDFLQGDKSELEYILKTL